jgi:hypothetical protein
VFRGSVLANGYFFPRALYPEALAARRIMGLWRPGASAKRTARGLFVTFPEPERVPVDQAPGAPLVRVGGALSSAPLPRAENAPPAGSLWLVSQGEAVATDVSDLVELDPSEWIDLGAFRIAEVSPFGGVVDPPEAVTQPESVPDLFDGRLGRTSEDRDHIARVRDALASAAGRPAPDRAAMIPGRLLSRLFDSLQRWATQRGAARDGTGHSRSVARQPARRPRETPWAWFRRRLAEALWRSRIMTFLGRAHARYLDRLFDMLDAHSDLDVLRHAIPLSGSGGARAAPALAPPRMKGTPRPRL